ncbi:hypothetical protein GQ55_3G301800 [Panicum hallii var. hallii]|uniref:Uncharacterized protein n=1 Tax=Panicum hallii var. hallii TaxID=1504633 RepID=A0A2T7EEX0_9POAL|nr:hypothetical protein GQ55_3G301800 [Panicum hallii var. hallii]
MVILLTSLNNTIDEATLINLLETDRSSFFTTYFSSMASPSSRIRATSVMNFSAKSSMDSASFILRLSKSRRKDWILASRTRSTPTCMERSVPHTSAAVSFSTTRSSVSSSTAWEMIDKASWSMPSSTASAAPRTTAPHAPLVRRMYFILTAHAA